MTDAQTKIEQTQQEYRFDGAILTSVEDYRAVPYLPVWLNPWWWRARRKASERLKPALHSDGEAHTESRWSITFRLTDVAFWEMDDTLKIGWDYTLTLQAGNHTEACRRAKTFIDEWEYAPEYTLYEHCEEQDVDWTELRQRRESKPWGVVNVNYGSNGQEIVPQSLAEREPIQYELEKERDRDPMNDETDRIRYGNETNDDGAGDGGGGGA